MRGIDGLRESLEELPLSIDRVDVVTHAVEVAGYPDGPRPSSIVTLSGGDTAGSGEHVGWTEVAHEAFRIAAEGFPSGNRRLGEWLSMLGDLPLYDRAAIEAAAIDLALRQQATNLFDLAGIAPRPARYVVSFGKSADPVSEARSLVPAGIELKIDADPAWPDQVWSDLASLGRVAVVDFKLEGQRRDHERAARLLPDAWIEDPSIWIEGSSVNGWESPLAARLSADAAVTSAATLEALSPRPRAVNVKCPRIGSVVEAISCLAYANAHGMTAYIGGMFEVGIGRSQSLVLAALACPDGPNDIAPLGKGVPRSARLVVDARAPGFGCAP